ncbi:MAG: S9 family peptidase [Gammaproteobacteria bacterium]|nr:S9 family peptidase [Gammaproteobacteria bacterium]
MKAPYGSWKSPITSDLIVAETIGIGGQKFYQGELFWVELRPQEGGRQVLVRRDTDGKERDITPAPFNMRTRVHEYGGGAWLLHENAVYFSNFSDQQVYKQLLCDEQPTQLTHQPGLRFANGTVDAARGRIIYVVEDHTAEDKEAENKLGAVNLETGDVVILADDHDFFASPTLSPDGSMLAWVTWDHPDMPWDETILWQADIGEDGQLLNIEKISGGNIEGQKISVQQPRFSPTGQLYFISDKSGWWNIFSWHEGKETNVHELEAEFGQPHWGFGLRTYQFLGEEQIICVYGVKNVSKLGILDLLTGNLQDIDLPYSDIDGLSVRSHGNQQVVFTGASASEFPGVVVLELVSGKTKVIKQSTVLELDKGYLSVPETIEFPAEDGEHAHAFHYPPANRDYEAPGDEKPPLIVMLHGGPTSATSNALNLRTQFWTSRGFAVLDVNYRGSTGYGREYRDKLLGNWGIVDVQDTVSGCNYLGSKNLVDMERLAIRGGSAGGYTTLSALTFTDTFKAGASHFGVSDLEALAKDTHKFESRYLDSVVGPYPEQLEVYQQRSPIHHVDRLSSACIFFQGLEDKVVPPNQAETMVEALKEKGIPVAYVPFEGEQHGFRRAENIKRCLDLELYFYSRIFGFTTADQIEPVEITNLPGNL